MVAFTLYASRSDCSGKNDYIISPLQPILKSSRRYVLLASLCVNSLNACGFACKLHVVCSCHSVVIARCTLSRESVFKIIGFCATTEQLRSSCDLFSFESTRDSARKLTNVTRMKNLYERFINLKMIEDKCYKILQNMRYSII